ncbi:MAG: SAM-dependent methyltransferase [Euryarchaeota archaeon]|nr:SAM-dependent methyltransferase [Euryarchaeota archaeon]
MNNRQEDLRLKIQKFADDAESHGTPLSWFEELYANARRNSDEIPWARMEPHPKMVEWIKNNPEISGKALVVGCGLGDDAEWLEEKGFEVTAFDVSESSIEWCKERFPNSSVNYCVANILSSPTQWKNSYDLIVEIHILQAVPEKIREDAAEILPSLLNNNGHLLCIGRLLDSTILDNSGPPWALSRVWLEEKFEKLKLVSFTHFSADSNIHGDFPTVSRFIAVWKQN